MNNERKADDAASLHSRMMSVRPRKPPTEIQADYESSTKAYAYACGHRDARHACAEIALEADRAIESLTARVAELSGAVDAEREACAQLCHDRRMELRASMTDDDAHTWHDGVSDGWGLAAAAIRQRAARG